MARNLHASTKTPDLNVPRRSTNRSTQISISQPQQSSSQQHSGQTGDELVPDNLQAGRSGSSLIDAVQWSNTCYSANNIFELASPENPLIVCQVTAYDRGRSSTTRSAPQAHRRTVMMVGGRVSQQRVLAMDCATKKLYSIPLESFKIFFRVNHARKWTLSGRYKTLKDIMSKYRNRLPVRVDRKPEQRKNANGPMKIAFETLILQQELEYKFLAVNYIDSVGVISETVEYIDVTNEDTKMLYHLAQGVLGPSGEQNWLGLKDMYHRACRHISFKTLSGPDGELPYRDDTGRDQTDVTMNRTQVDSTEKERHQSYNNDKLPATASVSEDRMTTTTRLSKQQSLPSNTTVHRPVVDRTARSSTSEKLSHESFTRKSKPGLSQSVDVVIDQDVLKLQRQHRRVVNTVDSNVSDDDDVTGSVSRDLNDNIKGMQHLAVTTGSTNGSSKNVSPVADAYELDDANPPTTATTQLTTATTAPSVDAAVVSIVSDQLPTSFDASHSPSYVESTQITAELGNSSSHEGQDQSQERTDGHDREMVPSILTLIDPSTNVQPPPQAQSLEYNPSNMLRQSELSSSLRHQPNVLLAGGYNQLLVAKNATWDELPTRSQGYRSAVAQVPPFRQETRSGENLLDGHDGVNVEKNFIVAPMVPLEVDVNNTDDVDYALMMSPKQSTLIEADESYKTCVVYFGNGADELMSQPEDTRYEANSYRLQRLRSLDDIRNNGATYVHVFTDDAQSGYISTQINADYTSHKSRRLSSSDLMTSDSGLLRTSYPSGVQGSRVRYVRSFVEDDDDDADLMMTSSSNTNHTQDGALRLLRPSKTSVQVRHSPVPPVQIADQTFYFDQNLQGRLPGSKQKSSRPFVTRVPSVNEKSTSAEYYRYRPEIRNYRQLEEQAVRETDARRRHQRGDERVTFASGVVVQTADGRARVVHDSSLTDAELTVTSSSSRLRPRTASASSPSKTQFQQHIGGAMKDASGLMGSTGTLPAKFRQSAGHGRTAPTSDRLVLTEAQSRVTSKFSQQKQKAGSVRVPYFNDETTEGAIRQQPRSSPRYNTQQTTTLSVPGLVNSRTGTPVPPSPTRSSYRRPGDTIAMSVSPKATNGSRWQSTKYRENYDGNNSSRIQVIR